MILLHNKLRDALYETASQAALGPRKEAHALIPGRNDKPADVYLPSWAEGKDMALDVTVVSPLQATLVSRAAVEAGHALDHAYDRKFRQAGEDCRAEGIIFQPLPVETLGGWHEKCLPVISKLGKQLARHTGADESEVVSHLYQRLSILLMKGNAALLLSRTPDFPPDFIDGVVGS